MDLASTALRMEIELFYIIALFQLEVTKIFRISHENKKRVNKKIILCVLGVYKSYWPQLNRTLRSSSVPRRVPELDTSKQLFNISAPPLVT